MAKVLTPENRPEVLPRFFHASKQEAKAVAAEIAPREVVPQRAVVTTVVPTSATVATVGTAAGHALHSAPRALPDLFHPGETPPAPANPPSPPPRSAVPAAAPRASAEPLTADALRLHVTVSKRAHNDLAARRAFGNAWMDEFTGGYGMRRREAAPPP